MDNEIVAGIDRPSWWKACAISLERQTDLEGGGYVKMVSVKSLQKTTGAEFEISIKHPQINLGKPTIVHYCDRKVEANAHFGKWVEKFKQRAKEEIQRVVISFQQCSLPALLTIVYSTFPDAEVKILDHFDDIQDTIKIESNGIGFIIYDIVRRNICGGTKAFIDLISEQRTSIPSAATKGG